MTKQEALEHTKRERDAYQRKVCDGRAFYQAMVDYLDVIIECIEKQIPKKPKEKESCFPNHLIISCPECCHSFGVFIRDDKMSKITTYRSAKFNAWCPNCGNKLDWSDDE